MHSYAGACQRLTLLAYDQLLALANIWLGGPLTNLPFVSHCMNSMFAGVGLLRMKKLHGGNKHAIPDYRCVGFLVWTGPKRFDSRMKESQ